MGLFRKSKKAKLESPEQPAVDVNTIPPIPAPSQIQFIPACSKLQTPENTPPPPPQAYETLNDYNKRERSASPEQAATDTYTYTDTKPLQSKKKQSALKKKKSHASMEMKYSQNHDQGVVRQQYPAPRYVTPPPSDDDDNNNNSNNDDTDNEPPQSTQTRRKSLKFVKSQGSMKLSNYPPTWVPPTDEQAVTFLPAPKAWNGSMLTIYDFTSAFRGYFHKVPHHLLDAVQVLARSVPVNYTRILDALPGDLEGCKCALDVDVRENRPFVCTDALVAYFLEEVKPPLKTIVQLAHTHNFMTIECCDLGLIDSFNTYHRNLAHKARASEEIRKYSYIQALNYHEFKDIKMDIDPSLSYDDIQQFVSDRAGLIQRGRHMYQLNENKSLVFEIDDDTDELVAVDHPPAPPRHGIMYKQIQCA